MLIYFSNKGNNCKAEVRQFSLPLRFSLTVYVVVEYRHTRTYVRPTGPELVLLHQEAKKKRQKICRRLTVDLRGLCAILRLTNVSRTATVTALIQGYLEHQYAPLIKKISYTRRYVLVDFWCSCRPGMLLVCDTHLTSDSFFQCSAFSLLILLLLNPHKKMCAQLDIFFVDQLLHVTIVCG